MSQDSDLLEADTFRAQIAQAIRDQKDWSGIVMAEVARVLKEGGDWCDIVKAQALTALVIGFRPRKICEIGVWMGGSMIPMLLGLAALEVVEHLLEKDTPRRATAIDAWSIDESCLGQASDDQAWWHAQSHLQAKEAFLARLAKHRLTAMCDVIHQPSDSVDPPGHGIELLHIDGNHGEQAIRDVERFATRVDLGGILVMDDLAWSGGHVTRARDRAMDLGFRRLYPLGTGEVLQRIHLR